MITDFSKSKIYKIVSKDTNKIYIGCTSYQELRKRLKSHLVMYKRYTKKKSQNYCTVFEILKYNNARIILIENCKCKNKKELMKREGYHIIKNKDICVNKIVTGRTRKETEQAYVEKCKLNGKSEIYKARAREYVKSDKHKKYLESIIDKTREYQRIKSVTKYKCFCGLVLCKGAKYLHLRNSIHKTKLLQKMGIIYKKVIVKKPKNYNRMCLYFNINNIKQY